MTLRKYLLLMGLIAILSWSGFVAVINFINPNESGFIGHFLFYSSLFLATVATLSIFGFLLRSKILQGELAFRQVAVTFRQAFWFGLLVTISLWLEARDLLTWWNLILLILGLTLLEFFFLSLRNRH